MRGTKKILFRVGIIVCMAAVLNIVGCREEKAEEAVPVVRPVKTIVVGDVAGSRLSFPGTVQGAQRVNLSFRVSGQLIELPINEGQAVSKRQFLARIDPRDYNISLEEAKASYEKADADFKRYQRLYERDAVPISDLDFYRSNRDVNKARLDRAQADLDDTVLAAPFSGNVGERYVENFEEIRAQQQILSLHDVSKIEIVVDVPEYLIATVKNKQAAKLVARFDTISDQEYPVEFLEASAEADPRTQTYRVTVIMPQPKGIRLLPGMTSEVRMSGPLVGVSQEDQYVIPAGAVFSGDDGTPYVWIVDPEEMTVHKTEVAVGVVTGEGNIRISHGITPGDRIVTVGVARLQEGIKIRFME